MSKDDYSVFPYGINLHPPRKVATRGTYRRWRESRWHAVREDGQRTKCGMPTADMRVIRCEWFKLGNECRRCWREEIARGSSHIDE